MRAGSARARTQLARDIALRGCGIRTTACVKRSSARPHQHYLYDLHEK
jgi:hypothetical protein